MFELIDEKAEVCARVNDGDGRTDLFLLRLGQLISLGQPLVRLVRAIDGRLLGEWIGAV